MVSDVGIVSDVIGPNNTSGTHSTPHSNLNICNCTIWINMGTVTGVLINP